MSCCSGRRLRVKRQNCRCKDAAPGFVGAQLLPRCSACQQWSSEVPAAPRRQQCTGTAAASGAGRGTCLHAVGVEGCHLAVVPQDCQLDRDLSRQQGAATSAGHDTVSAGGCGHLAVDPRRREPTAGSAISPGGSRLLIAALTSRSGVSSSFCRRSGYSRCCRASRMKAGSRARGCGHHSLAA